MGQHSEGVKEPVDNNLKATTCGPRNKILHRVVALRIPDSYDAKIAKICNLRIFLTKSFVVICVTALFTSMEHWAKRAFVGF